MHLQYIIRTVMLISVIIASRRFYHDAAVIRKRKVLVLRKLEPRDAD